MRMLHSLWRRTVHDAHDVIDLDLLLGWDLLLLAAAAALLRGTLLRAAALLLLGVALLLLRQLERQRQQLGTDVLLVAPGEGGWVS